MNQYPQHRKAEEGYLLLGLVVVCFIMLLMLGIAAPRVSRELERDREVESEHRAQEYVRAIQLYYRKNNTFPSSIDQLAGSGSGGGFTSALNVKYLRQRYKDPLTNDEYRLIHIGEAQTQVKGFFGEPLQGVAQGSLGALGGANSSIPGTSTPGSPAGGSNSGFGSSAFNNSGIGGASNSPSGLGSPTTGGTGSTSTGTGSTGTGATGTGSTTGTGTGTGSGIGSNDATTFQGSKGAIVGIGSNAKGHGLVEWNGSENIEQWEFLYDPRVELLKAQVSIFGGSPAASGTGSLGSGFQPAAGINAPATGPGANTNGGGFGSSTGSGFGSGSTNPSTGVAAPSTGGGTSGTGTSTPPTQ